MSGLIERSPNYFCTWATQNVYAGEEVAAKGYFPGDQGARNARNCLNETLVFGPNGWSEFYSGVRQDLYFLFDDGWDVPYGIHPDKNLPAFGSLFPDAERFPSCTGTPTEKLATLNRMVCSRGWRGAGLWIAAQAYGESAEHPFSLNEQKAYWRERLVWSRDAGINFWKVDWGYHGAQTEFRRMLTELAWEIHPALLIEHSIGSSPLNAPEADGRFHDDGRVREILKFSAVARIYDLLPPLTIAPALDRAVYFLRHARNCIVNIEDEVMLGAVLGCAFGIMRSPAIMKDTTWGRPDEPGALIDVERAIRWQRITPAWTATQEEQIFTSEECLADSWRFAPGSTWLADIWNQTVTQRAPAIVSRNMPLPKIVAHETEVPFVVSSCAPSGNLSFGILPRYSPAGPYTPEISLITNMMNTAGKKIGIFGRLRSLIIKTPSRPAVLIGQDLLSDTTVDLNRFLICRDDDVIIDGACFDQLRSQPGDGIMLELQ